MTLLRMSGVTETPRPWGGLGPSPGGVTLKTNLYPAFVFAGTVGAALCALGLLFAAKGGAHVDPYLIGVASAPVATWVVVLAARPGIALALWALAYANMLPFIDTQAFRVPGASRPEDLLVVLLVAATAVSCWRRRPSLKSTTWRSRTATLFLAACCWWLIVLGGTVLLTNVPLVAAALYGRDLIECVLVGLCVLVVLEERSDILALLDWLSIGAAAFSAFFIAGVVTHTDYRWMVHSYQLGQLAGQTRYYAWGHLLVAMLLPVALWRAVNGAGWRRVFWAGLTVLYVMQVLTAVWRANYVGVAAGLIATVLLVTSSPAHSRLRLRFLTLMAALTASALAGLLALTLRPLGINASAVSPGATASIRSLTSWIGGAYVSNYSYRTRLAGTMLHLLGRSWVWGLGFLHPAVHPVAGLPFGAIRNTDISFTLVLMPMGAIGLVLFYAPYLYALVKSARAAGVAASRQDGALLLGLTGALVCALIAGVTLVYLTWPVTLMLALAALVLADNVRTGPQDGFRSKPRDEL